MSQQEAEHLEDQLTTQKKENVRLSPPDGVPFCGSVLQIESGLKSLGCQSLSPPSTMCQLKVVTNRSSWDALLTFGTGLHVSDL